MSCLVLMGETALHQFFSATFWFIVSLQRSTGIKADIGRHSDLRYNDGEAGDVSSLSVSYTFVNSKFRCPGVG